MFWMFWSALYDLSCANMTSPWNLHCDCQKKADIHVSFFCSTETPCQCRRCKRCRFDPWVRKIPWRRKWQLIPVFFLGESHGQSLVGYYSPWGCKEADTTEHTHTYIAFIYYLYFILNFSSALIGRRWWQPTPVFLPGKSHGRRSLVGCSPWGH